MLWLTFFMTKLDCSIDGVLELEPMDPYSRLLLHRLADIFGFAHFSVGEGDERHIVLERCAETSVPSILVSDILYQYDESQPITTSHQLLRRDDAPPVLKMKSTSSLTLKEREAAYLAARERIFSTDVGELEQPNARKPPNVPAAARRMIAHALGRRINPSNQEAQTIESNDQAKDQIDPNREDTILQQHPENIKSPPNGKSNSRDQKNLAREPTENSSTKISGQSRNRVKKEYSKEEQVGAAKRMFAHALGLQSTKGGLARCSVRKHVNTE
ncbi:uncharacterized protein [Euphorbia lathyris]|uniref:uncharacterized protein isoform X2 n=1 Tax=Euphorbia lathyris TaxID=212925 RepID=UPI0033130F16